MTSRQIIQQTLDYASPPRVARSFGDSDMCWAWCWPEGHDRSTPWQQVAPGRWEHQDEWGNTWARLDATSKGEVVRPALPTWEALAGYGFPDYSSLKGFGLATELRQAHPQKWILGGLPGFAFNIARYMRMMDDYLADLLLERTQIHALNDRVDGILEVMIHNFARAGADAIMFPEDWGTQTQLLVSPDIWREEFFPRYQKLCGIAHAEKLKVFMHSCGMIGAIIPDLIRAGVDVLQFDQPDLHGIDALAGYQRLGRITFWCPVDVQKTLQTRQEGIIRAKAREMLDKLWQGRGGFIAGRYDDEPSIGLEPQWQDLACDEFTRHGLATVSAGDKKKAAATQV